MSGNSEKATKSSGDIILASDLNKKWFEVDFVKKHFHTLVLTHLRRTPEAVATLHKKEVVNTIIGYALIASLVCNFIEAHYPKKPDLLVSMSNETHDLVHMTTMLAPINTTPIIIEWTKKATIDALTYSFVDFDAHLKGLEGLFTEAGYAGYVDTIDDKYRDVMIHDHLDVSTVINGTVVVSHMATPQEPFLIVQVPVLVSFYNGSSKPVRSQSFIANVEVVPAAPDKSLAGKAINSLNLDGV